MIELFLFMTAMGFSFAAIEPDFEPMSAEIADAIDESEMAETATTLPPPEDQTPTGRFLTATEVKPILGATKASWIAVREWDGMDLIYFTQIESWRCGLHAVYYGVNGAPAETPWEMEPCYLDTAAPNAIKAEGRLPYTELPLKSVESVSIRIIYDDNTEESAEFARNMVLMP